MARRRSASGIHHVKTGSSWNAVASTVLRRSTSRRPALPTRWWVTDVVMVIPLFPGGPGRSRPRHHELGWGLRRRGDKPLTTRAGMGETSGKRHSGHADAVSSAWSVGGRGRRGARHAAGAGSSCAADRVAAAAEPGRARARPRAIDLGGGFARPGRQGAAPSRRAGAQGAGGAERGRRHPPARLPVGGGRIRDRCGPVRGAVPGRPGRRRPAYRRGLAGGGAGAVAWARLRGVRR